MEKIKIEELSLAVQGLKALAHPARLSILCFLEDQKATVNKLVEFTGMSQSAVSQHLSKMKAFGILKDDRDGNQVYYSVTNPEFKKLISALCCIYTKKSN
ncbi:MAG: metalloregulator ArsR/SmtB family transcription factor [Spirochaetia bacterium]|nr:metalloregulator ArsR/SmtB family transcription factor [Spirochaetia bacterium]